MKSKSQEVVGALISMDRTHRAVVEAQVDKLGIHRSQHIMLMTLSTCKKSPTQTELAEQLRITPAAVTVSLQKLEKNGYLTRTPRACDERANDIVLTDKGNKMISKSKAFFGKIDEQVCKGISDEELDSFMDILARMRENLEEMEPGKD